MPNYSIPEQALLQVVEDESVILNTQSGEYFTLDPVGTRMIQLFLECADTKKVAATISSEYRVETDQAYRDLIALLEQMVKHGLATRDET